MSGIYIKGMEMPTCCRYCACYHKKYDSGYYDYDLCLASRTIFNDGYDKSENRIIMSPFEKRLDNCPLISVPDHGKLIDADAIMARLNENGKRVFGVDGIPECSGLSVVADYVESAPTIIPADKEGEG